MNESLQRKIHGQNYSIINKVNNRTNILTQISQKIKEVDQKFKKEQYKKNRLAHIIEICQKNQNLHNFFLKVSL